MHARHLGQRGPTLAHRGLGLDAGGDLEGLVENQVQARAGEAQVCAVDCVSHALMARYRPQALCDTRILAETPRAPGLPYVTQADVDPEEFDKLRNGLLAAFERADLAAAREALLLKSVAFLDMRDYELILDMEREAEVKGYPLLV